MKGEVVKEMVEAIVYALVDEPDLTKVKLIAGDNTTVVEVCCGEPDDVGKVIGRAGRNADAIRTLVTCLGAKHRHRYMFQIDG